MDLFWLKISLVKAQLLKSICRFKNDKNQNRSEILLFFCWSLLTLSVPKLSKPSHFCPKRTLVASTGIELYSRG
jgi:hypothetical protein